MYTGLEAPIRWTWLKVPGAVLLLIGIGINIWLLISEGTAYGGRLALLLVAPGAILLFAAWLAENTPSLGGCLAITALLLAALAAFWAYVGVTLLKTPQDEHTPPTIEDTPPLADDAGDTTSP